MVGLELTLAVVGQGGGQGRELAAQGLVEGRVGAPVVPAQEHELGPVSNPAAVAVLEHGVDVDIGVAKQAPGEVAVGIADVRGRALEVEHPQATAAREPRAPVVHTPTGLVDHEVVRAGLDLGGLEVRVADVAGVEEGQEHSEGAPDDPHHPQEGEYATPLLSLAAGRETGHRAVVIAARRSASNCGLWP